MKKAATSCLDWPPNVTPSSRSIPPMRNGGTCSNVPSNFFVTQRFPAMLPVFSSVFSSSATLVGRIVKRCWLGC